MPPTDAAPAAGCEPGHGHGCGGGVALVHPSPRTKRMTLDAIATNAAIALLTSVTFLCLYRASTLLAQALSRATDSARSLRHDLVNGPGQRHADALRGNRTLLLQYKAAGLVFALVLGLLYILGDGHVNALPRWQAFAVLTLVCALVGAGATKAVWLAMAGRRLRFARNAHFVTAERLRGVCGDRGHVFHDVPLSADPNDRVDHLLVGVQGLYAVQVVDDAPRSGGTASVDGDALRFDRGGNRDVDLGPYAERVRRLQHQMSKELGRMITLRSIVAVPGWQVQGDADGKQLVVHHRNIVMLRGWRDAREFLMDEDAETLQRWCTARCRRHPPRRGAGAPSTEAVIPPA